MANWHWSGGGIGVFFGGWRHPCAPPSVSYRQNKAKNGRFWPFLADFEVRLARRVLVMGAICSCGLKGTYPRYIESHMV